MEICGICGGPHTSYDCDSVRLQNHVSDRVIPSKAKLTLPSNFTLEFMTDGRMEVSSNERIAKGTYFGPLEAPKLITLNPSILFPLKLFSTEIEDLQESFFDTSDENACNWLIFINQATCIEEQNMICFQEGSNIIYAAFKDIEKGELLKVWYSPYYAEKMKIPLLMTKELPKSAGRNYSENDLSTLLTRQQNICMRVTWTCKFCSKLENNVINFANHMIQHYSENINKICGICKEKFTTKTSLQKHIKVIHPDTSLKKKKCKIKESPNEKNKMEDELVGGPLLNNLHLNDSLDGGNLLELNNFEDADSNDAFLENDYSDLIESNDKELNYFYFEISDTEDNHVCDICLKPFAKMKTLLQHLRSHTGKFTCTLCLKVFTRNENLKAHDCTDKEIFKCHLCDKTFFLSKYLRRHIKLVHERKVTCQRCTRNFLTETEYENHKCGNDGNQQFECSQCMRVFFYRSSLHKHIKTHNTVVKQICEICGKTFALKECLLKHLKVHERRSLSCTQCDKKFYRKDIYDRHIELHKNEEQSKYSCEFCKRKFKTKRYLNLHLRSHSAQVEESTYQCPHCDSKFADQLFFQRHLSRHRLTCKRCKEKFETSAEHKQHIKSCHPRSSAKCYTCPFCTTTFKFKGSIARHIKNRHKEKAAETDLNGIKDITSVLNTFLEAEKSNGVFKDEQGALKNEQNLYDDRKEAEIFLEYDSNLVEGRIDSSMDNNLDDIVRNLESVVSIYNKTSYSDILNLSDNSQHGGKENFDSFSKNNPMLMDLNDLDLSVDSNLQQNFNNVQDTHVFLSMPDLNETNQDTIALIN